jgi:hypothetical protein
MNLLEIILTLHGQKSGERRRLLVQWGVDTALWADIQNCFTQDGMFVKTKTMEDFIVKINKENTI